MSAETSTIYIDPERDPLTWVRRYCEIGWKVVVLHGLNADLSCTCSKGADCRSAGKHPIAKAWTEKASGDFHAIAEQVEGRNVNIGLAMGHGLVALDVDGELGMESLEQLQASHPTWVPGPIARTGSGGMHMFFSTTETFTNKVKMMPGLDIRSAGGQVVACPSRHKSGGSYVWEGGGYRVPMQPLPDWLADIFRGDNVPAFDVSSWLLKQPPCISGENGSAQLMSLLGRIVRDGGVRKFEHFQRVFEPYNQQCVPPWSDTELEHAFKNAIGRFSSTACVKLPLTKTGEVLCTRTHLHMILAQDPNYEYSLSYNTRNGAVNLDDAAMDDNSVRAIELDICNRYSLRDLKRGWLDDSIALRAAERKFDPVVDYLTRLTWDGYERINSVPTRLLKCAPSPLASSMYRKWMVGAVARAMEPGCQMDTVLILHGEQGYLKSSWFRAIASPDFYDSTRLDLKNKDVYQQLCAWVLEWAELTNIGIFEVEQVKAFITNRKDTFRLPYDRLVKSHLRKGVIVGTTNNDAFLTDPTGSRRFWVLQVRDRIDLQQTNNERDQLWAEAVHLYRNREPWWFSSDEEAEHEIVNSTFQVEDVIYQTTADILRYSPGRIRLGPLALQVVGKPVLTGRERDAMTRALRDFGFVPGFVMENGQLKRGWIQMEKRGV